MKTMNYNSKAARTARFYENMSSLGFTYGETETLRRAGMTLHRWAERECNGEVERDEATGKTYYEIESPQGKRRRYPVPDRETGALKRIAAVIAARNARAANPAAGNGGLNRPPEKVGPVSFYHQTDPRGCALYILRPGDVPEGEDAGSYYSRGVAVCI